MTTTTPAPNRDHRRLAAAHLDPVMHAQLSDRATREGRTVSAVIRDLVSSYVETNPTPRQTIAERYEAQNPRTSLVGPLMSCVVDGFDDPNTGIVVAMAAARALVDLRPVTTIALEGPASATSVPAALLRSFSTVGPMSVLAEPTSQTLDSLSLTPGRIAVLDSQTTPLADIGTIVRSHFGGRAPAWSADGKTMGYSEPPHAVLAVVTPDLGWFPESTQGRMVRLDPTLRNGAREEIIEHAVGGTFVALSGALRRHASTMPTPTTEDRYDLEQGHHMSGTHSVALSADLMLGARLLSSWLRSVGCRRESSVFALDRMQELPWLDLVA